MINVSSAGFLYLTFCFACSFVFQAQRNFAYKLTLALIPWFAAQVLIFDPAVYKLIYYLLYPDYMTVQQVYAAEGIVRSVFVAGNVSAVIAAVVMMVYYYWKTPSIRVIKLYVLTVNACFAAIVSTYFYLMYWAPAFLVRVSKIAGYTSYRSVPLGKNTLFYNLAPYILMVFFVVILFFLYRYVSIQNRLHSHETGLSREIDAANTTSKVFCHYMKNELLAILAEVEKLQEIAEAKKQAEEITERCQRLYSRLDVIHRSTRNTRLMLVANTVDKPIEEALGIMGSSLGDFDVDIRIEEPVPRILMDTQYLSQAFVNLLTNAVDAARDMEPGRKTIGIEVQRHSKWVIITVRDRGEGIPPENLKKIFVPFYSSKPVSKNWGIGLSLCYRIIRAHEGKISVSSVHGQGTAFKIMLPGMERG
jgi:signal transduction histidine kinase